jgi:hypothetical protein
MANPQTPQQNRPQQGMKAPAAGKETNPQMKNQGEGDKESAARYNEDLQRAMKKSSYEHKAKEAARALDHEGPELRQAEEKGKARAKEEDPQVAQDFKKPAR